jgi:hypothetical protein
MQNGKKENKNGKATKLRKLSRAITAKSHSTVTIRAFNTTHNLAVATVAIQIGREHESHKSIYLIQDGINSFRRTKTTGNH